jgi:PRTRC genetic system protein A
MITREGVYEIRINTIGIFSTMAERFISYSGAPEYGEGVSLFLPRIDTALLVQIIGSFKKVYQLYGPIEAAAEVFWSLKKSHYYVHYPKQVVSGISIQTETDVAREYEDLLVLEIHSHHLMNARFSTKDDLNERALRFYAVVGEIDEFFPDIKLRYANARQHREVPLDTLFCNYFPEEWLKNIVVKKEEREMVL